MKKTMTRNTLLYGAKIYLVCLRSQNVPMAVFSANVRVLRHVLKFYGYGFHLEKFSGSRVLQYADIYDPWHEDPMVRERGKVFWQFIHWLKKNQMIPAFTAKE